MIQNSNAIVISDKEKAIRKLNGQAKTAIRKFLTELNIDRIIYIDDRCSIQDLKESYIGKFKKLYNTTKPEDLKIVDWELPNPIFDRIIETLWDDAEDKYKRELFLQVLQFDQEGGEIENSIAPLKLKEHLREKIELLGPSEYLAKKEEIIAELAHDSKILFLFDIEFQYAPLEDGRDGLALATELLNNEENKDMIYCGLFSHLFNTAEETEKRNEYCLTHSLDKEKFYTISKKRFQNDSYLPGLAEGIRNTLLINEVEFLKRESSKILNKSYNDSLKEIDKLAPDSFNHIIQKSSGKEGVWEMATLIRINNIVTNSEALKILLSKTKRSKINKSLANIRSIEKIKTGGETPFDKSEIKSLREKELYLPHDILNKLHFPTSNGDIFSINGKEYILLGQPCNLTLRPKGTRDVGRGTIFDSGFLLEIESMDQVDFNKLSGGQFTTIGIIENADVTRSCFKIVRFQSFKSVSLSPLDLTVFNEDGIARIYLNKKEHESRTIQDSWKRRYKTLHEEFEEYNDNICVFNKLKSTNKGKLKKAIYYGDLFKGYKICNDTILNGSKNKITLDIKRISHYNEPYSCDLLQRFMQYLSRNAFVNDFLKD